MEEIIEQDRHNASVTADLLAEIAPRTALFAKLLDCRAQLIAAGVPLLSGEEIEREKAERRG